MRNSAFNLLCSLRGQLSCGIAAGHQHDCHRTGGHTCTQSPGPKLHNTILLFLFCAVHICSMSEKYVFSAGKFCDTIKEKHAEELTVSIDLLQNKIRKSKNPVALWLNPTGDVIPPAIYAQTDSAAEAYGQYCLELLQNLTEYVSAVRVSFDAFALMGPEGLTQLRNILTKAGDLGYYVILDWQHLEDAALAEQSARSIMRDELWKCDAVTLCPYAGSDGIKPYLHTAGKKAVFVAVKTGNKSGSDLQDLQTGGRLVHTAAADLVSRWGENALERCGYSRVAAVAGAVNAASLRTLRQKFSRMFVLVEGVETSGANAKNCAYAFDRLGHGALVCAGSSVLGAWQTQEGDDYISAAKDAAERLKRNLTRYVTIL